MILSMNLDMAKKLPKVVLDTNILISALVYGGKPEQVYNLVLEKQITAIITNILVAELLEGLIKKFIVVRPKKIIKAARDEDDNRVLEAAAEGVCAYIVTGDKDLLELRSFN